MNYNIYIGSKNLRQPEQEWRPFALNVSSDETRLYIADFCDVRLDQWTTKTDPSEWVGYLFRLSGEKNRGLFGVFWKIEKAD